MADITSTLERLIEKRDLEPSEAARVADLLADGKLAPAQVTAFLVLLRAKGETGQELLAIAQAMRRRATPVNPLPSLTPSSLAPLVDIVGTGGDGHDTINVSTAAAIVAATCGARVAKHGNRSASSLSGSADVLEALGVPMLDASSVGECIDRAGIAFLFAPNFHPAMGPIAPIRKSLGIKTVFNILGPLLNPLAPRRMVLGVYTPRLLPIYADAVEGLDAEHALLVHCGGLDELATIGVAHSIEVVKGKPRKEMYIDPMTIVPRADFKYATIPDLKGGDAKHNAQVLRDILGNGGGIENLAGFETIALNAGATLYVSGIAASINDGFTMACEAMMSGQALKKLDLLASVAQDLKAKRIKAD